MTSTKILCSLRVSEFAANATHYIRRIFIPAICGLALLFAAVAMQAQQNQAASLAGATVEVRVVEAIDSNSDAPGKQYRGIVLKRVDANGATIYPGSPVTMVLGNGPSGRALQLVSLPINGQPVSVSSTPATILPSAQTNAMNTVNSMMGSFGHHTNAAAAVQAVASGQRVILPRFTQVQFVLSGSQANVAMGSSPAGVYVPGAPANSSSHPGMVNASSTSPTPIGGTLNAKVSETLLGPRKPLGQSVVSPDGGHYAVFSMHGSRETVVIDNVPGPDFDHAGHAAGTTIDFVFSPDGKHSCYIAQRGDDIVEVRDGKEAFVITTVKPGSGQGTGQIQLINQAGIHGEGTAGSQHQCLISSSGAHVAVVGLAADGIHSVMYLDGVKSPAYRVIDMNQIAFVGEKLVYAAMNDAQQWHMIVNDKPGPAYDKISSLLVNREDTHYAYIAQNHAGQLVVVDGIPGTAHPHAGNGIQYLTLASNGRCAYVLDKNFGSGNGGTEALVVDDKEISDSIQPFAGEDPTQVRNLVLYVIFSPDGKKFAYTKKVPGGIAAVIDGKAGRAYDSIGVMEFSPDSAHAFSVGVRNLQFVVLDGQEMDGWNRANTFVWSKEGGRLGYTGYSAQDGFHMIVDGKKSPRYYSAMSNTLSFSPDSKHYVYGACTSYMHCEVVKDDTVTNVPSLSEFTTRSYQPYYTFPPVFFSPDSSRLVYAYPKSDGTSQNVYTINGQEIVHGTSFEFPSFNPSSTHFAVLGWNGKAYALTVDGKSGPAYEEMPEANLNIARFVDSHTYRFLGIKDGSVYRVTVDLGE